MVVISRPTTTVCVLSVMEGSQPALNTHPLRPGPRDQQSGCPFLGLYLNQWGAPGGQCLLPVLRQALCVMLHSHRRQGRVSQDGCLPSPPTKGGANGFGGEQSYQGNVH